MNKNNSHKSVTPLIERFSRTYQFCNGDNNKFSLLLRKSVYPYHYTDDWERFKEVQLDTLLLAGVFENLRKTCQKKYQLHPAHFVSAPGKLGTHV